MEKQMFKQIAISNGVCVCMPTGTHTTHIDRHTYTDTDWHIDM